MRILMNRMKSEFIMLGYEVIFLGSVWVLTINFFKQGNRPDAIGFDLAETFTRPPLECFDHVTINKNKINKPMARQSLREVSQFVD
jgi:hypothetical protein